MIRKLFLPLIAILIGLFASPRTTTAQSTSNPYISYFSDDRKAFVIERADRTDTRILGKDILHYRGSYLINGPGWSPSGKWLAFSAAEGYAHNISDFSSYLIKSDGTRTFPIEGLKNPAMAWSPNKDLLLVTEQWRDYNAGVVRVEVALLDPENRKRIELKPEIAIEGDSLRQPYTAQWMDDNHALAEFFAGAENNVTKIGFLIIDLNGSVIEKTFERVAGATPFISKIGNIGYMVKDTLIIENLMSGKRFEIEQKFPTGANIYWSPDGRYGILTGHDAWLLDVEQEKLSFLRSTYQPGDYTIPTWSPDSQHAVLYSEYTLYHISINDNRIRPIAFYPEGTVQYSPNWYWSAAGQLQSVEQSYEEPPRSVLRQYDFQTDQYERFDLPEGGIGTPFSISPDGRSVAWIGDGSEILEIRKGTLRKISPSSHAFNTNFGGEVVWSADSNWLMTFDDAVMAGGGPYRHVSVVRRDGSMRRHLTFADGWRPNYFGFLSERVKISDLQPVQPKPPPVQPYKILYGNEWVLTLSWSPDGRQIASALYAYFYDGGTKDVQLWDVNSGESARVVIGMQYPRRVRWVREPGSIDYLPTTFEPSKTPYLATNLDGSQGIALSDGFIKVYDTKTGKLVQSLQPQNELPTSVSYSVDGHWLAIGNYPAYIRIYDTQTWQVRRELQIAAFEVAFSPNGEYLAATDGWDIDIWKVSDLIAP